MVVRNYFICLFILATSVLNAMDPTLARYKNQVQQEKEFTRTALELATNRNSAFSTNINAYKTEIPSSTNWTTQPSNNNSLSLTTSASGLSFQVQSSSLSSFDVSINSSTNFKAGLSVKSSEKSLSNYSKLQEAIDKKKQIDFEKCKTVLQHRDLILRQALEARMYEIATDIEQAISVLETCAKEISQPRDAHYFVNFLKIKIREPQLNEILLKAKAQIAQYICDPKGVLKEPSLQDEKKIAKIVENFKLEVQSWVDNHRFSVVDQVVDFRTETVLPQPDSNSFPALGNSYYEKQLAQNSINKDLLEIDRLCQLGKFNEAAPLVEHYGNLQKQTVLSAEYSNPYSFAHLLYHTKYTQKYDSYGIEKKFAHDPAYKTITPTLQELEVPRPNPEINDYFHQRATTFNQIASTLNISTMTPELKTIIYTVVDIEQNLFEVSHTLAQPLSSDHSNKNIKNAYAKFYNQQSLPKLYKWHESLAHLKVPAHFSTQEYAPERALLTDLALLHTLNSETNVFKNGIDLLVQSSPATREECRVLAQALIATGIQKKHDANTENILNLKNLPLTTNAKEHREIQTKVHKIAAHIVSRAYNPECQKAEKEKLNYLLQKIDTLYGKVIAGHSSQAQQELTLLFSSEYMQKLMNATPRSIELDIKTRSISFDQTASEIIPETVINNENLKFEVNSLLGLDTKLTTPESLQTIEFDTKLFQEVLKDPELAQLIHEAFEKPVTMSPSFPEQEKLSLYQHVDDFLDTCVRFCDQAQKNLTKNNNNETLLQTGTENSNNNREPSFGKSFVEFLGTTELARQRGELPAQVTSPDFGQAANNLKHFAQEAIRYGKISGYELAKKSVGFGQGALHPIETAEGIIEGLHKVGELVKPFVEFMGQVELAREFGTGNLEMATKKYEEFTQNISNIHEHLQNLSPEEKVKFATDLVFDFKVAPVLIAKAGKVAGALTKASKELVQNTNIKALGHTPEKLEQIGRLSDVLQKRADQLNEAANRLKQQEHGSKVLSSAIKGLKITEEAAVQLWNESKEFAELNKIVNDLEKTVPNTKTFSLECKDLHIDEYLKIQKRAENIYDVIRNNPHDIKLISQNTKIPINIIEKIKNHVFFEEHILNIGVGRFPADFDAALVWQRLIDGNFIKSDLKLLQHEFAELLIMRGTVVDWNTAHPLANKIANWQTLLENN